MANKSVNKSIIGGGVKVNPLPNVFLWNFMV